MFPGPSRHPGVGPSPVSVKLINCFIKAHEEIRKCNEREEGAQYPTSGSLHKAIMKIPGLIWKWSKSTSYYILLHLGFR